MIATGIAGPLAPSRSRLAIEQAVIALRAGDRAEAEQTLRRRLLEAPNDADVLAKLAGMALDQRRVDEATLLLRRAATAEPTAERHLALVRHLHTHSGAAPALDAIEEVPPAHRTRFDMRAIEADCLGMVGRHERQIALYQALAVEQPANSMLWKTLGDALKTVGRTDEAVAALRRAIDARPSFGEAWWTLSNFKSLRFSDGDVRAMEKALRKTPDPTDSLHFHFALGKAYDDRGSPARAFRHYAEGNRLRAAQLEPGDRNVSRFVDRSIGTFSAELFEARAGAGCPAADPIFVVGLHRSGSTLIEQILASHPAIEGTAELPVMQHLWDRLVRTAAGWGAFDEVAKLDRARLRSIGEEYLERARAFRRTDRPHFVDKLPANWMNLGLIRLILPNAKIIDARRHPMACGFSNFRQHYATGVTFSYSMESIGLFYRDYLRQMEHFDRVQPGAVHHILNERLIEDPEGEVRRLLDFVGVDFDPACLDFHRNRRAVRTPSAEQVRRPINRDGVDSWRPYQRWLGPLEQAFGDALERWDKV